MFALSGPFGHAVDAHRNLLEPLFAQLRLFVSLDDNRVGKRNAKAKQQSLAALGERPRQQQQLRFGTTRFRGSDETRRQPRSIEADVVPAGTTHGLAPGPARSGFEWMRKCGAAVATGSSPLPLCAKSTPLRGLYTP